MSRFADIQQAPPIAVFSLTAAYKEDTNPRKVNAGVGAYRTDEGKPWMLPVVRQVESQMAADNSLDHEYLPIAGLPEFTSASINLILGEDNPAVLENRVLGFQTLSGTGVVRLGAVFLRTRANYNIVYLPEPTWPNHIGIFQAAHFPELRRYRYFKPETKGLDFDGMIEDLRKAPENAVIVLHTCAHNPTGVDPSQEQWKEIADVCKERNLFVFFDAAYIGFATGSVERDSWPITYFVKQGIECFVAQSYAKNFGLYNERTGCLLVVVNDANCKPRIKSQMEKIVRVMWSNPPNHGCRIVSTVLNNPTLHSQWVGNSLLRDCKQEVGEIPDRCRMIGIAGKFLVPMSQYYINMGIGNDHIALMSSRIMEMRQELYQRLKALGTPGTWNHIVDQIGMFSYTGLGPNQVEFLKKTFSVYMMKSGRMNMCALNTKNVDYVANAIHKAVSDVHEDPKL